jgi:hypothetical protein
MTEHERFREMLARRSELPSQDEALLREHLDDCPDCRETATAYSRQTALLRSLPVADPPPALRAAVLSGIRGRRVLSFWRGPAVALAPVAAALLAVAGGLTYLNLPHGSPNHSASGAPRRSPTSVVPGFSPQASPTTAAAAGIYFGRHHRSRTATATPVSNPPPSGQVASGAPPSSTQSSSASSARLSTDTGPARSPPAQLRNNSGTHQKSRSIGSGFQQPTQVASARSSGGATPNPAAPTAPPTPQPTMGPTNVTTRPVAPTAPSATPVPPPPPTIPTPTPQAPGVAVSSQKITPTPTPTPGTGSAQPAPSGTPSPTVQPSSPH